MSYGDEARMLGRVLPSVCSDQSLERLASMEALPLPLFNTALVIINSNILIVEIVIGYSSHVHIKTNQSMQNTVSHYVAKT